MSGKIYVDTFDSAGALKGKQRTYDAVKAKVIEAGRFSVFEACEDSNTFNHLVRDPDIETFGMGFPWTGVRLKEAGND